MTEQRFCFMWPGKSVPTKCLLFGVFCRKFRSQPIVSSRNYLNFFVFITSLSLFQNLSVFSTNCPKNVSKSGEDTTTQ